jgi:hypothetical protein
MALLLVQDVRPLPGHFKGAVLWPGADKQMHDANLVAATLIHGVRILLAFNATDFQRFAGTIEIEVPARS